MSAIRFVALLLLALVACTTAPEAIAVEVEPERPASFRRVVIVPAAVAVEPERADLDLPDTCDPLVLVDTPSGPQLSKQLPAWMRSARERAEVQAWIRGVVEVVGDELGADPLAREVVYRKAILESSGNPGSVHVRSRDIEANRRAAKRARAATADRWARARVPVHQRHRGELQVIADFDALALGRGLYGMISTYAPRWSADAPPWSLCDPVVATVVAYWALRSGLAECRGRTLRDAYRRFSSGRCALRERERERAFDRIARGHVRGLKLHRIDPDARADFGERWPELTSDRAVLLAKLRRRVEAEVGGQPGAVGL